MSFKRLFLPIVCFCLLFIYGCKNDRPFGSTNENASLEDIYFEDYESPRSKWTFVDRKGVKLFKPKYDNLRDFCNGLALANYKGKWGAINMNNDVVIPFEFKELSTSDTSSLIIAKNFNNQYLLFTLEGQFRDSLDVDMIRPFKNDFACFKKLGSWGVMNKNLETIIEPIYHSIEDFKNNHLIGRSGNLDILIDVNQNRLLEANDIYWINERYLVYELDKIYSIAEVSNGIVKTILKDQEELLVSQNEIVFAKNGQTSNFIDLKSTNSKSSDKDIVESLGYDLWSFSEKGKMGIVNSQNEMICSPIYDIIYPFSGDLAVVSKRNLWGFINLNGEEAIVPKYPLVWSFNKNLARVFSKDGIAFINKSGEIVIKGNWKYEEFKNFKNGYARVQQRRF